MVHNNASYQKFQWLQLDMTKKIKKVFYVPFRSFGGIQLLGLSQYPLKLEKFSMTKPSKLVKKATGRLNATWISIKQQAVGVVYVCVCVWFLHVQLHMIQLTSCQVQNYYKGPLICSVNCDNCLSCFRSQQPGFISKRSRSLVQIWMSTF